jgi:hypothetical protein
MQVRNLEAVVLLFVGLKQAQSRVHSNADVLTRELHSMWQHLQQQYGKWRFSVRQQQQQQQHSEAARCSSTHSLLGCMCKAAAAAVCRAVWVVDATA